MYFITTKRMLEVCFSAHPNIQYRTHFTGMKILTSLSGASNASTDDFLYIRLPFLKGIIESVFMIRYAMRLNMI